MEPPPPSPPAGPSQAGRPSATSAATTLRRLERLDPTRPHTFVTPAKRIHQGPDVYHFLASQAYRDIGVFVLQLNRALCPRKKPAAGHGHSAAVQTFTLASPRQDPPSVKRLQQLLERVGAIVEEAPPDPGPRRFGNVSFRMWYRLLEERADALLREYLAPEVVSFASPPGGTAGASGQRQERDDEDDGGEESRSRSNKPAAALDELKSYFLGGFGSPQRLDFGTGHELSFLAFLGCLWKLGAFSDGASEEDVERSIVLGVIEPYLKVVRRLILTYTLEPAGSHGVWGLDDHFFIPYIFGSAQLTQPIAADGGGEPPEPMPQEGSVLRAPKPADVTRPATVEVQRELNLYFSAIGFIDDVKKGPFWEHSPILFDVSGIRDGWGKINKGMIKMYNAEVLSKFPVVQHFPFGSLFSWARDPDAPDPATTVHVASQPSAAAAGHTPTGMPPPPTKTGAGAGAGMAAPWAQALRMPGDVAGRPGIPYSRVPAGASSTTMTSRMPPPPLGGGGGAGGGQGSVTKAPWVKDS